MLSVEPHDDWLLLGASRLEQQDACVGLAHTSILTII